MTFPTTVTIKITGAFDTRRGEGTTIANSRTLPTSRSSSFNVSRPSIVPPGPRHDSNRNRGPYSSYVSTIRFQILFLAITSRVFIIFGHVLITSGCRGCRVRFQSCQLLSEFSFSSSIVIKRLTVLGSVELPSSV